MLKNGLKRIAVLAASALLLPLLLGAAPALERTEIKIPAAVEVFRKNISSAASGGTWEKGSTALPDAGAEEAAQAVTPPEASEEAEMTGAGAGDVLQDGESPDIHAHDSVENKEELPIASASKVENGALIDAPYINQRSRYPNGCESVSAVMALQYLGVDIDPDTFISEYLDMGRSLYWKNGKGYACAPREKFPGDPRNDSGWGCYPEVIKKAVDKMELEGLEAVVLKDASLSTLCSEYIDNGVPVVFWGTIDMRRPSSWVTWNIDDESGRMHTWTSPFHCLLLVGYDSEYYYFNDPWRQKNAGYTREAVEVAYSGMGREALVIVEK